MKFRRHTAARRQRGVAAIEFALIFLMGVLPLLLITFSGVMIFATQQSLSLASAEGARAALQYGTTAQRQTSACIAAQNAMAWLLAFSGDQPNCAAPQAPGGAYTAIAVSGATPCPSNATMTCITVVTSFNYNAHPFIPGTKTMYGWLMASNLSSSATVQMNLTGT